jgi:hypothetical protein
VDLTLMKKILKVDLTLINYYLKNKKIIIKLPKISNENLETSKSLMFSYLTRGRLADRLDGAGDVSGGGLKNDY